MEHLPDYLHNHPFLVGIAALLVIIVAVYEFRARAQNYSAVLPQEAIRLMNGGAIVFDVRDAESYAAGHITGARALSAEQIAGATDALKKYKQKNLIVYCEQGVSAAGVVRKLHAQGFTQVFNLKGGLAAWRAESLPLQRS